TEMGDQQEQYRDCVQAVGEVVGSRYPAGRLQIDRRAVPATVLPRRERHQARVDMSHVLTPTEAVQLSYPAPNRGIAKHDDMPTLPVAAAGREPGVVEDAVHDRIRHCLVSEDPGRRRRPHHLVEIHGQSTYRSILPPEPARFRY